MATLYLHIGTPKTGTTAIQLFCKANQEALAKRGFSFPLNDYYHVLHQNARFLVQLSQNPDGSFASDEDAAEWNRRMEYLAGLFREQENVILSDEVVWHFSRFLCPGLWKNLKRAADAHGFDVRVIVYLRRQDQFLSSLWAQWVKGAYNDYAVLSWEQMLQRIDECMVLDYYGHLEEIAAVFGREDITVRIYDRKRFPDGNIISDFLGTLGLTLDADFVDGERDKNRSISGNVLEVKRIINTMSMDNPAMLELTKQIALKCSGIPEEKAACSMFSEEELDAFLGKCEASNRCLARVYFGDENLELFERPGQLPPKWEPNNPRMYETIIRFFWMLFCAQQQEIERMKRRPGWWLTLRKIKRTLKRGLGKVLKPFA